MLGRSRQARAGGRSKHRSKIPSDPKYRQPTARAIGMKRENVAHPTVDGRRNSRRLSEFDHCTAKPINFQSVAALQIMVHRGGHLRWEAVAEGEPILSIFDAEGDALCAANGDYLAHGIQQQSARPGICTDRSDQSLPPPSLLKSGSAGRKVPRMIRTKGRAL